MNVHKILTRCIFAGTLMTSDTSLTNERYKDGTKL